MCARVRDSDVPERGQLGRERGGGALSPSSIRCRWQKLPGGKAGTNGAGEHVLEECILALAPELRKPLHSHTHVGNMHTHTCTHREHTPTHMHTEIRVNTHADARGHDTCSHRHRQTHVHSDIIYMAHIHSCTHAKYMYMKRHMQTWKQQAHACRDISTHRDACMQRYMCT